MPSDGTKVTTGYTVVAGIIAVLTAPVSVLGLIGGAAATTACVVYKIEDTFDEAKVTLENVAKDAQETLENVAKDAQETLENVAKDAQETLENVNKTAKDVQETLEKVAKDAQETLVYMKEKANSMQQCFNISCLIITIVICVCGISYLVKNN